MNALLAGGGIDLQQIAALSLVAAAAVLLLRRGLQARKKNSACGGDCGCAKPDLARLAKR